MKTSPNGRKLIEQFEGCILQSYDDANDHIVPVGGKSSGTLTIGYGHTSAAGAPTVKPGMVITKDQADLILASDLTKVEDQVNSLVKVSLSQNQFDALVSFQFNTGALKSSSVLKAVNAKDYDTAAEKLMGYVNGRVDGRLVPMAGLTKRRTAEKALFLKKDSSAPTTAGVAILGGAAGAAAAPHDYWPWIGAGVVIVLIGAVITYFVEKSSGPATQ